MQRGSEPEALLLARAVLADRLLLQLLGWGFRPRPAPEEGLLLPRCRAVHTAFMRFPIDLLYLLNGRVAAMRAQLPPWRVSIGPRGADALELPAGTLARLGVRVGDRVTLEEQASGPGD